jgi:beta-lactamase superfamily II metal-dependent hydrolase
MATVEVLDVGHGVCAALTTDDGKLWLFDCGRDGVVRPSVRYYGRPVDRLFVSNYDQDHISDLPGVVEDCGVRVLTRNPTITAGQLRAKKTESAPVTDAMETLLAMIQTHTGSVAAAALAPPGVQTSMFWNTFSPIADPDRGLFDDTNNISLATFLHVHGLHMLLPGDLEETGWRALLRNPAFRAELGRVNVFMASHHGRRSGYCEEVFKYCKPQLIVVSDSEKVHETQEMGNAYAEKASGLWLDNQMRSVLTTRYDGTIYIVATPTQTLVDTDVALARAKRA